MKRVWELDVLECPRCHGPMRLLAAIHTPDATRRILECLGLPSRAPPIARAASELAVSWTSSIHAKTHDQGDVCFGDAHEHSATRSSSWRIPVQPGLRRARLVYI